MVYTPEKGEKVPKDFAYGLNYLKWRALQEEDMSLKPNLLGHEKAFAGVRKVMKDDIEQSASEGRKLGLFVHPTGPTEDDKGKASFKRQLASLLGYEVGGFEFNLSSGILSAPLKKRQPK